MQYGELVLYKYAGRFYVCKFKILTTFSKFSSVSYEASLIAYITFYYGAIIYV